LPAGVALARSPFARLWATYLPRAAPTLVDRARGASLEICRRASRNEDRYEMLWPRARGTHNLRLRRRLIVDASTRI
jgi:hypothetical protein